MESANLLLSRAVCGRSPVFGRSVDAGAVDGRAARAWPRVLYGAVLGLSITGDGASFNAASASTAADVRWKKFTGMFGQPFNYLTCTFAAPERQRSPGRARPLPFVWSRIACVGGKPSGGLAAVRDLSC